MGSQQELAQMSRLDDSAAEIADALPSDLASLTSLIRQCLHVPNRAVRISATGVLYGISARVDSAQPLVPYEDDLIGMSDDPDGMVRSMALEVLEKEYPRPSPKTPAALAARLTDSKNSGDIYLSIGCTLLGAYPSDDALAREVIAGLSRYASDRGLKADLILQLGLQKVTAPASVAFIRAGFGDPRLRSASIQAVAHMPKDVRDSFVPELQMAATDRDPEIQSAASAVLIQH